MSNKYLPECKFCNRFINKPLKTKLDFIEIIAGRCSCGAVFVCDPTGHNEGEAYLDALVFLKGDWDIYGLVENVDYYIKSINYDLKSHTQIYAKGSAVRYGKLLFVKTVGSIQNTIINNKSVKLIEDKKTTTKKEIKQLLETKNFEGISQKALVDRGVIRWIISFSFDKEDPLTWSAIEAMGYIAKTLYKQYPQIIRETIRKLIWSMTDEAGAIGWSAPEFLGEIIRSAPDEFQDIIPILWSYRKEDMLKNGVLWAMVKIAEQRADLVSPIVINELKELITTKSLITRSLANQLLEKL